MGYVSVQNWILLALRDCPPDQRKMSIDLFENASRRLGSHLRSGHQSTSLGLTASWWPAALFAEPLPPVHQTGVQVPATSPVDLGALVPALWGLVADADNKALSVRLGEALGKGTFGEVRRSTTADGFSDKPQRPGTRTHCHDPMWAQLGRRRASERHTPGVCWRAGPKEEAALTPTDVCTVLFLVTLFSPSRIGV